MKMLHKVGLSVFIGVVFLLLIVSTAKIIELYEQYQESTELLYICKAHKAISLSGESSNEFKDRLYERESKAQHKENYKDILESLNLRIQALENISQEQKEHFKAFISSDNVLIDSPLSAEPSD